MNRKGEGNLVLSIILIIVAGACLYFWISIGYNPFVHHDTPIQNEIQKHLYIKIANWNLQIFGLTKANNETIMQKYVEVINNYDIVFVQEIRDTSGYAFSSLCSRLPNFQCTNSSRAGRTISKEQYGIIYRNGIKLVEMKDYNPDSQDRWERPPINVVFEIGNTSFSIYNIHVKPEDVKTELSNLQAVTDADNGKVIVLGDMNADCDYYDAASNPEFDSYSWIIKDEMDTTSKATDCAYDRIILNQNAYANYIQSGIYTNTNAEYSDHYPVWVEERI
jgi:endonuclease/exonuclease/phosphatase family metal-dependent hydrolase